tara:strand:- start:30 stop:845 length:816 start_codon:yes stop_codon:yes gene_type:complete
MDEQNVIDEIAGEEDTVEESQAPEEASQEVEAKEEAKTVPLTALQEARHETREFRDQLQQANQRMARMETVFDQFRGQASAQEPVEVPPSYDDDPDGYLRNLGNRVDAAEQRVVEQQHRDQASNQEQQFLNQYAASVRTFSNENPDFQDAYAYLAKTIDEELKIRGITDPTERANVIQYEEGRMVGRAMHEGRNPAQTVYDFARHRGYTPNGQEDGKLDQLKKGAEASKSLSGAGKSEGSITLSRLSELADTDPEAFDREFEKAKRQGLLG